MWSNKIETCEDLSLEKLREFRRAISESALNDGLKPQPIELIKKAEEKCPHLLAGIIASYNINGTVIVPQTVYDELEEKGVI